MDNITFDNLVNIKIEQIMKAVKDYQNNPNKADKYIRTTIANLVKAGQLKSEIDITKELFG